MHTVPVVCVTKLKHTAALGVDIIAAGVFPEGIVDDCLRGCMRSGALLLCRELGTGCQQQDHGRDACKYTFTKLFHTIISFIFLSD